MESTLLLQSQLKVYLGLHSNEMLNTFFLVQIGESHKEVADNLVINSWQVISSAGVVLLIML